MATRTPSTYQKPNPLCYGILRTVSRLACRWYYPMEVLQNDLKGKSGRCVILANHESDIDFLTAFATLPKNTHVVASNSIMRSMPIYPLALKCGIIPKNQFQTNASHMRKMKAVLDHDEPLLLYPAGLMTESGISTPIPKATGKVIKWFHSDVYVAKVSGTYLTKPKWGKVRRKGKITMRIYPLVTKEQLDSLSVAEVDALIEQHLSFDAYRENEQKNLAFVHGDNVEGLEHVLYQCPACGKEYTVQAMNGTQLCCSACGYSVTADAYGLLHAADGRETIYRYPSDWHAYIERTVSERISAEPDFRMQTTGELFQIDDRKHRYVPVGPVSVTLTLDRFVLEGIKDGQPFYKEIPTDPFPILPFKPGKQFEIQCGEEIYRIRPNDGRIVMKWIFAIKASYRIKAAQRAERSASQG